MPCSHLGTDSLRLRGHTLHRAFPRRVGVPSPVGCCNRRKGASRHCSKAVRTGGPLVMPASLSMVASAHATLVAQPAVPISPMKSPATLLPVVESEGSLSAGGHTIIRNLGSSLFRNSAAAPAAGVVLGAAANDGLPTSSEDMAVGQLVCTRFLACARIKIYWMAPEWGSAAKDLPPETQFLLLQLSPSGPYAIILPLIDSDRKGKDSSKLMQVRVESGDASVAASRWNNVLLVAAGTDPYDLVDAAVSAAAEISGAAKARTAKQLPDFVKAFGWCTWDAFYSRVSAEGINEGLRALEEGGVPPKLLIIDDGWQTTELDAALRPPPSQEEVLRAEQEVLMGVGKVISKGSDTAMGELSNQATVIENGAHAHARKQRGAEDKPNVLAKMRAAWDHLKGWLVGILAAIISALYTWFIEHAPPDSRRIRWFTRMSKGKLRDTIRHFYAQTSDHVKRLASVLGNGKFSAADADADTPLTRPEALGAVVKGLKARFGLSHVFCWHSFYGYWAGIAPDSPEMATYNPRLVWPEPGAGVLDVDPCFAWNCQVMAGVGVVQDIRRLYNAMHAYLASACVDGVKVDCQSTIDMIGSALGGSSVLSGAYHAALEESVAQHFPGNACINCMCHSTNDLYRMTDTAIARSSDDFWPRDPASHTTHVAINAANSLFMAALVQPDWDMFQSQHPAALMHASARVVSGGPVYVSDRPGKHDFDLLKRVVLPDGSVLLCSQPGRPTVDCIFADPMRDGRTLLKVWNTSSASGVVGVFNVQGSHWSRSQRQFMTHDVRPHPLTTRVRPSDVPQFASADYGSRFALYSDRQQRLCMLGLHESLVVALARGESDLVTVVPITMVKGLRVAAIGLTNMLNTGASIQGFQCAAPGDAQTVSCTMSVCGCGSLLLYATSAPCKCLVNGVAVQAAYAAEQQALRVPVSRSGDSVVSSVEVEFHI